MSGFDTLSTAIASGTARRTGGSLYCSMCSSDRPAICAPRGSAIAMSAMPMTAGPWCIVFHAAPSASASVTCSPHIASSCCTLSTSPVPAYASDSSVTWQKRDTCSLSVLDTSSVASTVSCLPKNSSPSDRHRYLAYGDCRSASERHMSACSTLITMSSLHVDVNTRPSASAAKPDSSIETSPSATSGSSSSSTSARLVPAYARPRPSTAPMQMFTSGLLT
eukprot:250757-Chlamydomonas_euryale.AAC.7